MWSSILKQPPKGVPRKRYSENMQQIYRITSMPKCDFNKLAKQLYWNRTSAWVFSWKLAAYFQNTFLDGCFWVYYMTEKDGGKYFRRLDLEERDKTCLLKHMYKMRPNSSLECGRINLNTVCSVKENVTLICLPNEAWMLLHMKKVLILDIWTQEGNAQLKLVTQ